MIAKRMTINVVAVVTRVVITTIIVAYSLQLATCNLQCQRSNHCYKHFDVLTVGIAVDLVNAAGAAGVARSHLGTTIILPLLLNFELELNSDSNHHNYQSSVVLNSINYASQSDDCSWSVVDLEL